MNKLVRAVQKHPLTKNTDKQRGVALIIVLSIIVLITSLIVGVTADNQRNMAAVERLHGNTAAINMAELGINLAKMILQFDEQEDKRSGQAIDYYFQLNDDLGNLESLFLQGGIKELWSFFRPGQTQALSQFGLSGNFFPVASDGGVEIYIEDETSKWNPARLVRQRGITMEDPEVKAAINGMTLVLDDSSQASEVVASLIDWIDSDSQVVDPAGAETSYYQSLTPPYAARNAPLQHRDELRAIRGVDEKVFSDMVSAVTVWPATGTNFKININTANIATLGFLDERIDYETAERIVDARDEKPFRSITEVQSFFQNDLGLQQVWGTILDRGIVDVRSTVFYVLVTGYDHEQSVTYEAVLQRSSNSGQVNVLLQRRKTLVVAN